MIKYSDEKTGADAKLFPDKTLFIYGTGEEQDVKQDLKFLPTLRKEIKGHKGSYEQARFLLEVVDWSEVEVILGHSLGGSVALWLHIWTQKPTYTYGAFRPFSIFQKLPKANNVINCIFGWDAVPRIFFWRRYIGKVVRIKGKGFHPATDHLRYKDLDDYVGYMKDLL